jgi:hypothetical protein
VRAFDRRPRGTYCVELKEAAGGTPCITEINAGRFPSGVTALLALGKHNMVEVFASAAVGAPITVDDPHGALADHYLVRDIDAVPGIVSGADLTADAPGAGTLTVRSCAPRPFVHKCGDCPRGATARADEPDGDRRSER